MSHQSDWSYSKQPIDRPITCPRKIQKITETVTYQEQISNGEAVAVDVRTAGNTSGPTGRKSRGPAQDRASWPIKVPLVCMYNCMLSRGQTPHFTWAGYLCFSSNRNRNSSDISDASFTMVEPRTLRMGFKRIQNLIISRRIIVTLTCHQGFAPGKRS